MFYKSNAQSSGEYQRIFTRHEPIRNKEWFIHKEKYEETDEHLEMRLYLAHISQNGSKSK